MMSFSLVRLVFCCILAPPLLCRRGSCPKQEMVLGTSAGASRSTRESMLEITNTSSRSTSIRPVQVAMMNCNMDAMRSLCDKKPDGRALILKSAELWPQGSTQADKLANIPNILSLEARGILAFPVDGNFWNQAGTALEKMRSLNAFWARGGAQAGGALTEAISTARQLRANLTTLPTGELSRGSQDEMRVFFSAGGTQNIIGGSFANFLEALFGDGYIAVPLDKPYFRFNYDNVQVGQGKPGTDFHADACGFVRVFVGTAPISKGGPSMQGQRLGCSSQTMPFDVFFVELLKRLRGLGKTLPFSPRPLQQNIMVSEAKLAQLDPWETGGHALEVLEKVWGASFVGCLRKQVAVESAHPWIDDFASQYNLHFLTVEDANQALAVLPRQPREIMVRSRQYLSMPCEIETQNQTVSCFGCLKKKKKKAGRVGKKKKAGRVDSRADILMTAEVLEKETDAWIFQTLGKADVEHTPPETVASIHAAVQVVSRGGKPPKHNRESAEARSLLMDTQALPKFFGSVWEVCAQ